MSIQTLNCATIIQGNIFDPDSLKHMTGFGTGRFAIIPAKKRNKNIPVKPLLLGYCGTRVAHMEIDIHKGKKDHKNTSFKRSIWPLTGLRKGEMCQKIKNLLLFCLSRKCCWNKTIGRKIILSSLNRSHSNKNHLFNRRKINFYKKEWTNHSSTLKWGKLLNYMYMSSK